MRKTFCENCKKEVEAVDGKIEMFAIEIDECKRDARGNVVEKRRKVRISVCGSCEEKFESAFTFPLRRKTNDAVR